MIYKKTKQGHFAYEEHLSILSPFYIARKALDREVKKFSHTESVLDVGSGGQPYRKYFNDYTSLERQGKSADYVYTTRFPFENKSFDTAICTQVLEHVFEPNSFLSEIRRVTRGRVLVTCPLIWGEHEQPNDYGRYTSFGLRHLMTKNGFKVVYQGKTCNNLSALFQIINTFIYSLTYKRRWTRILGKGICIPITLLGICFSGIKTDDIYLDNIIIAI